MSFQFLILKIYDVFLKRIETIFIPFFIILTLFTGITLKSPNILANITHTIPSTIHTLSGLILFCICVILIYDEIIFLIFHTIGMNPVFGHIAIFHKNVPRSIYIINFPYYLLFILLTFSCFSLHILNLKVYQISLHEYFYVLLFHRYITYLFILIFLIKYYLHITHWLRNIRLYLNEYQ